MAYEVTATRKRPKLFDELAGQEFVVSTLKNAIASGRIAHAYLFSGPRGVGKTSAARILARALNCEKGPTETPCGICPCCEEILKGSALDVIEIDGASNTSVNDVRQIKDEVLFAPNTCRYKVYIIDEVHMLSNSAYNALLKTIEEPPPYIVFIFATTEIHKVPATIRSRCQQFNFRLIPLEEMVRLLEETAGEVGVSASREALFWIAKEATGSLRDAYTIFDQVVSFSDGAITLEKIQEKLGVVGLADMNSLLEACAAGDRKTAFERLDGILSKGVAVEQFVFDCAAYFRSLLFLSSGITKEGLLGFKPEAFSAAVVREFPPKKSQKAIELLFQLYRNIRYSANQRFELELVISRLSELKTFIDPAELVYRLEKVRASLFDRSSEKSGPASDHLPGAERKTLESGVFSETADAYTKDVSAAASGGNGAASSFPDGSLPDVARTQTIQLIRKKKLSLASSLEKGTAWTVSGPDLTIIFSASFPAQVVNRELPEIAKAVEAVTGRRFRVSVRVEEEVREAGCAEGVDQKVEMVRKIFRGEMLSGDR